MPKILIIEDDTVFCQILQRFLTKHGFDISVSHSIHEAQTKIRASSFDLILSDVRLPNGDGITLLTKVKEASPETQVILMTGYAKVTAAVSAMKKGAFDYISKPFTPEDILSTIQKALYPGKPKVNKGHGIEGENQEKKINASERLIGISETSRKLQQYVSLVAPTNMSVLLTGESGTGKEVTARTVHDLSNRGSKRFIAVDCGAIPKELGTSEFFGHIKGSFTGAVTDKKGHFEAANGGTLFLDEVGNLSYRNQIQLLRAIQERKIKRVGSTEEIDVDVRIIAATNEDLTKKMKLEGFREDLFHRLNEFSIQVPSLRERSEDLMLFANYFLEASNSELGKRVIGFSKEVEDVFKGYTWPGNLRELKNVVKRAVLFSSGKCIHLDCVLEVMELVDKAQAKANLSKLDYEKERILRALEQTNYNKSKAAKLLQMARKTLYNKINQYQLEV